MSLKAEIPSQANRTILTEISIPRFSITLLELQRISSGKMSSDPDRKTCAHGAHKRGLKQTIIEDLVRFFNVVKSA